MKLLLLLPLLVLFIYPVNTTEAFCDDIEFEHQRICCEGLLNPIIDAYDMDRIEEQGFEPERVISRIIRIRQQCLTLPEAPQSQPGEDFEEATLLEDELLISEEIPPQSPFEDFEEPQLPPTPPALNEDVVTIESSSLVEQNNTSAQQAAAGGSVSTSEVSGSLFSGAIQSAQAGWRTISSMFCSLFGRNC